MLLNPSLVEHREHETTLIKPFIIITNNTKSIYIYVEVYDYNTTLYHHIHNHIHSYIFKDIYIYLLTLIRSNCLLNIGSSQNSWKGSESMESHIVRRSINKLASSLMDRNKKQLIKK